jgi:hypothetical protein
MTPSKIFFTFFITISILSHIENMTSAKQNPQTIATKKQDTRWPVARTGAKLCLRQQKLSPAR